MQAITPDVIEAGRPYRTDWMRSLGMNAAIGMGTGDEVSPAACTDIVINSTAAIVSARKGGRKRIIDAMHGKRRTGHGTFLCPICGCQYKVRSMALKCVATPTCKAIHMPGNGRLRKWKQQAFILDLAWRLGTAIVRECDMSDNDLTPQDGACGQALAEAAEHAFRHIREYTIDEAVVAHCLDDIQETAAKVFGVGHPPISCWPMSNAILDLAGEIIERYAPTFAEEMANGKAIDGLEAWEAVRTCLQGVVDTVAPTYEADRDTGPKREEIRTAFHRLVFGEKAKPREPGVYLLDDGIYAAYGREELRRYIAATAGGRIEGHIEGMSLGEVLEDGRTVGSLLEGRTLPCRVARLG